MGAMSVTRAVDGVNAALRMPPIWPFYALGFIPAGWYLWLAVNNQLGADPVLTLEKKLGLIALQVLIATLCVTPLRALTGVNLLRYRRMLGLMAYYYVMLHLSVWLLLDRQLDGARILADLTKRPYVIIGMTAFILLTPLALTSTNWAIRRMGGMRWRNLHRLIYPAAALGAIHFVWLVKAWPIEPLAYAAGVATLLGYRALKGRKRPRARVATG